MEWQVGPVTVQQIHLLITLSLWPDMQEPWMHCKSIIMTFMSLNAQLDRNSQKVQFILIQSNQQYFEIQGVTKLMLLLTQP